MALTEGMAENRDVANEGEDARRESIEALRRALHRDADKDLSVARNGARMLRTVAHLLAESSDGMDPLRVVLLALAHVVEGGDVPSLAKPSRPRSILAWAKTTALRISTDRLATLIERVLNDDVIPDEKKNAEIVARAVGGARLLESDRYEWALQRLASTRDRSVEKITELLLGKKARDVHEARFTRKSKG